MRNWKAVNEKYIKEGELYLSFDFLKRWQRELRVLNEHKEGARYEYPVSLIQFCSVLKVVFHLGFRQEQGFLQALQKWIPIPTVPSYSQINRRMNSLGIDIVSSLVHQDDGRIIAVDSSGIKLYNSGEWIREKHHKRKPFLKLHVAVNVKTKQVVSLEITEDSVGDQRCALGLVDKARAVMPINKALLDGIYDVHKIWKGLEKRKIQPVIRLRTNASPNGLGVRARRVRERKKIGEMALHKKYGYGQRWQVETWYSSYKRRFGEHCYSTKPENVIHEILFKTTLCNKLIT